jgi:hypothetical protein
MGMTVSMKPRRRLPASPWKRSAKGPVAAPRRYPAADHEARGEPSRLQAGDQSL